MYLEDNLNAVAVKCGIMPTTVTIGNEGSWQTRYLRKAICSLQLPNNMPTMKIKLVSVTTRQEINGCNPELRLFRIRVTVDDYQRMVCRLNQPGSILISVPEPVLAVATRIGSSYTPTSISVSLVFPCIGSSRDDIRVAFRDREASRGYC